MQQKLVIGESCLSGSDKEAILSDYFMTLNQQKASFLGYQTNQQVEFPSRLWPFLSLNLLNLGDGFEEGSYRINAKQFERAVLDYYAQLCGFAGSHTQRRYWGYLTAMGSTEGNLYALWNARDFLRGYPVEGYADAVPTDYPPVLICSAATHYSIHKASQMVGVSLFHDIGPGLGACPINQGDWQQPLAVDENDAVIIEDLYALVEFFTTAQHPIILVLNHGATFSGGSDAIYTILTRLKPLLGPNTPQQRRYWIHVDGALAANFSPYLHVGSAPFSITNEPNEFRHPEVMSLCTSPYKWLGMPWACGIYLMQERYKVGSSARPVYIGSRDSTVSGSRQGIFSLYLWDLLVTLGKAGLQRLADANEHLANDTQHRIVRLFQQLDPGGKQLHVMPRPRHSNIVRFTAPNPAVIEQFSLAQNDVLIGERLQRMCHVVILSHVTQAAIERLLDALAHPNAFSLPSRLQTSRPQNPLTDLRSMRHRYGFCPDDEVFDNGVASKSGGRDETPVLQAERFL
ncbi:pyridoxal-dependent decarboxylase [Vibrio sp. MEBiC08052]|uniref:pyridoxal-dependent decarboxylase n=1 Tax=Vibrio sp. MEBiC08052 TaxID=1761910 RepID=UPI00074072F5|nr:pyridoxal-dependent decarboxylase [Vibrio sp. MEBiC08052]KUI98209.1 glutamate decarboxylase [Vibrio sp. MEBiC08052]